MEKQKSTLAIKILIFILLILLIMLIPIKAMASSTTSFWVMSSVSECYEGETATISIIIYNDTGAHILPTYYYFDGTYYPINTTFMVPKQNMTINRNITVYFSGAESVTYDVHLVYHEDGHSDTYTKNQSVTIQKSAMQVITPQPMTIITPVPTSTQMTVITPQPTALQQIDVPTPDFSNMKEVTPTPENGINLITATPESLPQMPSETDEDNAAICINENQQDNKNKLNTVSDAGISLTYIENGTTEQKDNRSIGIAQNEGIKTVKNTFTNLDVFTKICLAVIALLSVGYVFLTIRVNKIKKDMDK